MNNNKQIYPLSLSGRVDNTFTLFFSRFLPMFLVSLIFVGISTVLTSIISQEAFSLSEFSTWMQDYLTESLYSPEQIYSGISGQLSDMVSSYFRNGGALSMAINTIASLLLTPFAYGVIAVIAAARVRGESLSFGGGISAALSYYGKLVLTNLCSLLVVLGAVIAVMLGFILLVILLAMLAAASSALYIFLLFILSLAVFILVSAITFTAPMAHVVVVTEGLGYFKAVGRAWSMMFSRFWHNYGTILLAALASSLIGWILSLIGGLFTGVASYIASAVITCLTFALPICAAVAICFASRYERGEFDIIPTLDLPPPDSTGGPEML